MKNSSWMLAVFFHGVVVFQLRAADPAWLVRLHSPDVAVRRAAIDEIQTLDDTRIPGACLPLLDDEGASIRRQAARAIGSRFSQIPKGRIDIYIQALRKCAARGPEDVTLIAGRAMGLLTRDYSRSAFSTSPDGKWVLYERRRRPVVASVQRQVHTLLSPKVPEDDYSLDDTRVRDGDIEGCEPARTTRLLKLMATNETASDLFSPVWHPQSIALEFNPIVQMKFFMPICIWRASDGDMTVWSVESFNRRIRGSFPHWSTTMEFVKWDGPHAVIRIYDCDNGGQGPYDPKGILVSIDIRTWKAALVK